MVTVCPQLQDFMLGLLVAFLSSCNIICKHLVCKKCLTAVLALGTDAKSMHACDCTCAHIGRIFSQQTVFNSFENISFSQRIESLLLELLVFLKQVSVWLVFSDMMIVLSVLFMTCTA